jgi:hypothetical protein
VAKSIACVCAAFSSDPIADPKEPEVEGEKGDEEGGVDDEEGDIGIE